MRFQEAFKFSRTMSALPRYAADTIRLIVEATLERIRGTARPSLRKSTFSVIIFNDGRRQIFTGPRMTAEKEM